MVAAAVPGPACAGTAPPAPGETRRRLRVRGRAGEAPMGSAAALGGYCQLYPEIAGVAGGLNRLTFCGFLCTRRLRGAG